MKRQFTDWELVFATHTTREGLMLEIHKNNFHKLRKVLTTQLKKKKDEWRKKHFTEQETLKINRNMKRCSTLSVIREVQIKTAVK